jgi:hypothetical protein
LPVAVVGRPFFRFARRARVVVAPQLVCPARTPHAARTVESDPNRGVWLVALRARAKCRCCIGSADVIGARQAL